MAAVPDCAIRRHFERTVREVFPNASPVHCSTVARNALICVRESGNSPSAWVTANLLTFVSDHDPLAPRPVPSPGTSTKVRASPPMRFPVELAFHVYNLVEPLCRVSRHRGRARGLVVPYESQPPVLAGVCREMREEILSKFYRSNIFILPIQSREGQRSARAWVNGLGNGNVAKLQNVVLYAHIVEKEDRRRVPGPEARPLRVMINLRICTARIESTVVSYEERLQWWQGAMRRLKPPAAKDEMESKAEASATVSVADVPQRMGEQGFKGTHVDQNDMQMLGKAQQLNAGQVDTAFESVLDLCSDFRYQRNFKFISILGFTVSAMSTWEITLSSSVFGLINGGLPGLVWGYLVVWMGYFTVFAQISEMASMSPTSGGQYHWVSEFSPPGCQKFLSYMVGWVSVLGWQTGYASLAFIAGTLMQGLISFNNPHYNYQRWHGTLLVIAITAFCILFNTFLAKRLPMVEAVVLVVHTLGFFGVLIALWACAPSRNTNEVVFTEFTNFGGWSSTGLSVMVGLLSTVYGLLGADSAVHMAEEIRDSSIVLPRATMWAFTINGGFGFIMIITYCFTLGDPAAILETPTGYPVIAAFYNATGSTAGTSVMVAVILIDVVSSCISSLATCSRQLFSFARDGGLPFSGFLSHIKPGWNIPTNAVCVTFVFTALLSLINIGSTAAFNAIASMATNALLSTYIISMTCLLIRRLRGPVLPPRRWSLGSLGLPINVIAVLFLLWIWTFCFFPQTTPVTLATMNWNVVINAGVMLFAVIYYFAGGAKMYVAPLLLVQRDA
ncbi:hypothetical protein LTR85_001996 [Meristemomyces frigidus]|nr:hypothetical protein LTR85_001996 [Meristemomyces frigidus]